MRPYAELVEEALCSGWVDSKAKTLDERRTRTRRVEETVRLCAEGTRPR